MISSAFPLSHGFFSKISLEGDEIRFSVLGLKSFWLFHDGNYRVCSEFRRNPFSFLSDIARAVWFSLSLTSTKHWVVQQTISNLFSDSCMAAKIAVSTLRRRFLANYSSCKNALIDILRVFENSSQLPFCSLDGSQESRETRHSKSSTCSMKHFTIFVVFLRQLLKREHPISRKQKKWATLSRRFGVCVLDSKNNDRGIGVALHWNSDFGTSWTKSAFARLFSPSSEKIEKLVIRQTTTHTKLLKNEIEKFSIRSKTNKTEK